MGCAASADAAPAASPAAAAPVASPIVHDTTDVPPPFHPDPALASQPALRSVPECAPLWSNTAAAPWAVHNPLRGPDTHRHANSTAAAPEREKTKPDAEGDDAADAEFAAFACLVPASGNDDDVIDAAAIERGDSPALTMSEFCTEMHLRRIEGRGNMARMHGYTADVDQFPAPPHPLTEEQQRANEQRCDSWRCHAQQDFW